MADPMSASDKIRPLEELSSILADLRGRDRRIVHCHGVFDLLHVGHLRYFQEARALGDVLVVTLTTDRFVNKGPHRPAFPEQLRAEMIAALECVDYVAVSTCPTAVEAIGLLRPHLYVKGPDYKDASRDVTGGIYEERRAVEAAGGRLVVTEGIVFSSTNLINRHMSPLPEETQTYLAEFAARHPVEEVLGWLRKASDLKVLVVGEAIIDEYVYCTAIGKSSKEPTLVVRRNGSEQFAGGVLAAANHVAGFAGKVAVLTQLGTENSHEAFIDRKLRPNVERIFLRRPNSPTIVKRRMVEEYFFTKLLEVYEINDAPLSPEEDDAVCEALLRHVPEYDLVLAIDFGHSLLGDRATQILREKSRFLAVNAQCNAGNMGHHAISRYRGADFVTATEMEARIDAHDRTGDIRRIVGEIRRRLGCGRLVVTRGRNGCLCCDEEGGLIDVPAVAGKVVDRIGAGDAFLSVASLLAVQGAPLDVVGFVGNAAGALAVATVGNREPVDPVLLHRHVESLLK